MASPTSRLERCRHQPLDYSSTALPGLFQSKRSGCGKFVMKSLIITKIKQKIIMPLSKNMLEKRRYC